MFVTSLEAAVRHVWRWVSLQPVAILRVAERLLSVAEGPLLCQLIWSRGLLLGDDQRTIDNWSGVMYDCLFSVEWPPTALEI